MTTYKERENDMDKRMVAIEWKNDSHMDNVVALLNAFGKHYDVCNVVVFCVNRNPSFDAIGIDENSHYSVVFFPDGIDTISKRKNFILDYAKDNMPNGFLHIVEDIVVLDKDPLDYMQKLESAMDVFDYYVHFSTVTDPCNYIFKKFNPRLTIDIDDEDIKSKLMLPDKVSFTSHSNTCWTTYSLSHLQDGIQKFNEQFTIAMYIIIEYLAKRREMKKDGQLYYMNQYLSISDEVGTFHVLDAKDKEPQIDPTTMRSEDEVFKAMKVNYAPDNNIDVVLDAFYQKIQSKMH